MKIRKSRREFIAAGVAAAGALALVPPAQAGDTPANPTAATAEALANIVRARFGKHVTDAQMKAVQQNIRSSLAAAETLKRTRLENSDEPDFVFSADGPSGG